MLMKFMEASEKRHDVTDTAMKEQRTIMKNHHAMMIDQQALIKNQQASINNLEVQLGQLTTLVNEKMVPKNPEKKTQSHVIAIDTEEEAIFEFLEALEVEPQQPDPKPKKPKLEFEESGGIPSSRREPAMLMSWARSEQKKFVYVPAYKQPLPFPSRANFSPLEREHLEFIKQLKGIPINTPFIDSLAKVIEYAKFLQDLLDTRQQLNENSKVILSEQSSKAVLREIPKKMGDPGRLTLPCEFGNNMKVYALADSEASINLMPYSFYQKLNIQKLKATKMSIYMANRSVTQPRGIVEDIIVKIGKFIFPINFVVLDMKEDPNVPIILGRSLLNTAGALVDIHESKLTLRVGDENEIFGIEDGFQRSDAQEEVFNIDKEYELEELEKLMEEEIKTIQQVKKNKTESICSIFS
ncbi:uncharacterized protein LOC128128938 [Lactuca sativa]|uniref:uncharacterized protein LOC128128938 n=1 Tax=Lactuca sativa TaxID=4236 RepID=UPI0022AE94D8|nr:uncharacterized protein LOC128128938 [Lactuca sativa]